MANFGLGEMRLVTPRDGWPNPSAGPAAAGADFILDKAQVFETTADAVADCAHVFATTDKAKGAEVLPHVRTDHWITDPISSIVSFYGMVDAVAARRGLNPDTPRHLNKVTETV